MLELLTASKEQVPGYYVNADLCNILYKALEEFWHPHNNSRDISNQKQNKQHDRQ